MHTTNTSDSNPNFKEVALQDDIGKNAIYQTIRESGNNTTLRIEDGIP